MGLNLGEPQFVGPVIAADRDRSPAHRRRPVPHLRVGVSFPRLFMQAVHRRCSNCHLTSADSTFASLPTTTADASGSQPEHPRLGFSFGLSSPSIRREVIGDLAECVVEPSSVIGLASLNARA